MESKTIHRHERSAVVKTVYNSAKKKERGNSISSANSVHMLRYYLRLCHICCRKASSKRHLQAICSNFFIVFKYLIMFSISPGIQMRFTFLFLLIVVSNVHPCDYLLKMEIDTNKRLLQITPDYNNETALEAHRILEKLLNEGKYDLINDFYMLFRYRDEEFISNWIKIITENPQNEILQLWFINAVNQIGIPKYLRLLSAFKDSKNAILREYVANSYGFLGSPKDTTSLLNWYKIEDNCYVKKTIQTSVKTIKIGGYKSTIPYLPMYYDEKPLKIQFLFNKKIIDNPKYQFELLDTLNGIINSSHFIFPHQQYLWRLKHAPRRGFFGSKTGDIYHIGNDSGWLLEGLPIHAVCDGIVKQISHNLSWGTLVVIESYFPKTADTLCAIYGHLSPFLDVNISDTVKMGDKIGQIGNSASFDNGGYWAHLHFGIEISSFWHAQISGYDRDTMFYENPAKFIQAYMKKDVSEHN